MQPTTDVMRTQTRRERVVPRLWCALFQLASVQRREAAAGKRGEGGMTKASLAH